ncbi:MAG: TlpA disulfide reductase family protein [Streptosporangiaceae bacterium]|jgi:cytochrome c biogenesis protein CcmG/thiol:disulfide interchange protein DsbE
MDDEEARTQGVPGPAQEPAAGQRDLPAADGPAARHRSWAELLGGGSRTGKIAWGAAAVVVAVIAVLSVTGGAGSQPRTLPLFKNFTLKALGHPGSQVSLAALAGRPVIVNFFASWCPPCKRETPLIARYYRATHGTVVIIGVDSNDETAPAEQFLRRSGVTYPVGFDPFPASTTVSHGVFLLPQTFFLNARHDIVKHVFGALSLTEIATDVALMEGRGAALAIPQAQHSGQSQDRG